MRKAEQCVSWVVYVNTGHKQANGLRVVCEQDEWDRMELDRPGHHTLVRSGITTEAEAERLARGTSGDPKPKVPRVRLQ